MHSAISQPNKYLIHKLLFSVLDHVLLQSTPKGGFNSHKFVCVRVRGGGACACVWHVPASRDVVKHTSSPQEWICVYHLISSFNQMNFCFAFFFDHCYPTVEFYFHRNSCFLVTWGSRKSWRPIPKAVILILCWIWADLFFVFFCCCSLVCLFACICQSACLGVRVFSARYHVLITFSHTCLPWRLSFLTLMPPHQSQIQPQLSLPSFLLPACFPKSPLTLLTLHPPPLSI